MTARVEQIWHHPIKSHGREELSEVALSVGKCLPWDRRYAVAHERSCFDVANPRWQPCREFSRGSQSPRLQAIRTYIDHRTGKLTVSHPDRVDLTFDPETEGSLFVQWVMPISNGAKTLPSQLVRGSAAMTDSDFASISVINLASHRDVEAKLGREISPLRWRGNLLIDHMTPWAEFDLIGKKLTFGAAELEFIEPIGRCMATTANTDTGERDADTLGALRTGFGHQDMGVYAMVTKAGEIRQGDKVELV
jgi:uncharacterized protein